MASSDQLHFQEFEEAAVLLSENPNATTKSSSDETRPQHATLHMGGDSEGDEEETDQTELLAPEKKPSGFWTFQYYQDLFDVDTYQVLDRIRASFIPIPGRNFVRHHLRNNPDLYGSFICISCQGDTSAIFGSTQASEDQWFCTAHAQERALAHAQYRAARLQKPECFPSLPNPGDTSHNC
ncbi:protein YIPF2-like [Hyperolius riggenbachi]|uniref:protein YIPF2-like n=1 Tax=Hyperolius riggenbachi TaxID=752182 RepID=UPI0035A38C68